MSTVLESLGSLGSIGIQPLRRKLRTLAAQLGRTDLSRGEKALMVTQQALQAAHLTPHVEVGRQIVFELGAPPKVMRGLRDLVIRRGSPADLSGLGAVEQTDDLLMRQRFDRGDLVYLGQLEGRILCHSWFHRGPQPFDEDQVTFASWELGPDTFWSYAAAATPDSQSSGVFVKVFQTALQALFHEHGAERVQCLVRHSNDRSILLHERNGFRRLGTITAVALPWIKWLYWEGPLSSRHWLVPRVGHLTLPLPPVAPPMNQGVA